MSTAAIHAFATRHHLPLDLPGHRRAAVDIIEGDVTLDPDNATFLPRYVWVEGAYTLREEDRVMVVRPITDTGHLGPREIRELPVDTVVTAWEGPTPEEVTV
jgi:hypothetical protein